MFKKRNTLKAAQIALSVILLSVFILGFIARDIFAQNQNCPTCPSNNDQQKNTVQGEKKVVMVGNVKVTILPSKYTQEFLEKTFSVPEEWKEWYKLQKEGKLPINIKIVDYSFEDVAKFYKERTELEFNPDHLADYLLNSKKKCKAINENKINEFKIKIKKDGKWGCVRWWNDVYFGELFCTEILPLYIKCVSDEGEGASALEEVFSPTIKLYKTHPLFFKEELSIISKYLPLFWDLYKTSINKKPEEIFNEKSASLTILFLLNEDIKIITPLCKDKARNILIQVYDYEYLDPVNKKIIHYIDPRLREFYDWILSNGTSFDKAIAFKYFKDLGLEDNYIDKMTAFCKENLNWDGLGVFQLMLDSKNDPRVIDLAKFYLKLLNNKILKDPQQEDLIKKVLIEDFGFSIGSKKQ